MGELKFSKRDVTSMTTLIHGHKPDSRPFDWTPALAPSPRTGNYNWTNPVCPSPEPEDN